MEFIFQGFQSPLPLWSYLLIFIGTTVLAWWSYSHLESISKVARYGLITLRSSVFFVLLLILANPFIERKSSYFEPPKILMILDNSSSSAVEKSQYKGLKSYKKVLNTLNPENSGAIDVDIYSFGSQIKSTALDSLSFDADQTNLAEAVDIIKENQAQADAAVLVSDGIYTHGQNPVFASENINIPVFTIGLGDSTSQKDLMVRSVSSNSTGYLNTKHPVTATVSNRGFPERSFQVQLLDGNQIIESKTINSGAPSSTKDIIFQLPLTKEGLQQYSVRIPPIENEWTPNNNQQRFSVKVKNARQNILSLAFELHPDVRFFRSLLLSDQNTELIKRTWIRGNSFIEGNMDIEADSIDLAIIHGYPRSGLPTSVIEQLNGIAENVPLIVQATPLFSPRQFSSDILSLPVMPSGRWEYQQTMLHMSQENRMHPILEIPAVSLERLPELSSPIQNIDPSPGSTVLFSSIYQGNTTEKPILSVRQRGNRRLTFFASFDWFKMGQTKNPQIQEFAHKLILNTVSWTATEPDNKLLEVNPVQTTFSGSEKITLHGFLQNERGTPEANAAIDLTLTTADGQKKFYSMDHTNAGQYRLQIGSLPEGLYSFEAVAQKADRTIDTQSGEFAVARSNAEFLDIRRNDKLLQTIADRTGGTYHAFNKIGDFWKNLDNKGLLDKNEKFNSTYFYPHQNIGWFVLIILLLAAEWMLRKYLSLP